MLSTWIRSRFPHRSAALATLGVCSLAPLTLADEPQVKDKQLKVIVQSQAVDGQDQVSAPELDFWLGILLKEVEGDLASYLGTDQGVLVDSVFPDSPAASAGVEKGDVILKVGDDELSGPGDLLKIMQNLKIKDDRAEPLALTVLRKGQEKKLVLNPAPRPNQTPHAVTVEVVEGQKAEVEGEAEGGQESKAFSFSFSGDAPNEEMKALLEKIHKGNVDGDVKLFRLGNPSMLFIPEGSTGDVDIQIQQDSNGEKLEVKIQRVDDQPAKITVKSGDDVQEFTEEQLEQMPEKVRSMVEPILKKKMRVRVENLDSTINAELNKLAEEVRTQADQVSQEALRSAEILRIKALEAANVAAKEAMAIAAGTRKQVQGLAEVEELRKLVEELRSEVKSLRKQLEDDD